MSTVLICRQFIIQYNTNFLFLIHFKQTKKKNNVSYQRVCMTLLLLCHHRCRCCWFERFVQIENKAYEVNPRQHNKINEHTHPIILNVILQSILALSAVYNFLDTHKHTHTIAIAKVFAHKIGIHADRKMQFDTCIHSTNGARLSVIHLYISRWVNYSSRVLILKMNVLKEMLENEKQPSNVEKCGSYHD